MRIGAKEKLYILETTGLFVIGLGMMLLLVISAWVATISITGTFATSGQIIGTAPRLQINKEDVASINNLLGNNGQVAGVVDDSSDSEDQIRNLTSTWLTNVRTAESLNASYRDSVLDRSAQNQARLMADNCDINRYSDWSESLGKPVSEGDVYRYSEAAFAVGGVQFASDLPLNASSYARIFQDYDAYGIGVAAPTGAAGCDFENVLVIHFAHVR